MRNTIKQEGETAKGKQYFILPTLLSPFNFLFVEVTATEGDKIALFGVSGHYIFLSAPGCTPNLPLLVYILGTAHAPSITVFNSVDLVAGILYTVCKALGQVFRAEWIEISFCWWTAGIIPDGAGLRWALKTEAVWQPSLSFIRPVI